MKLGFALVLFLALLPTVHAFFFDFSGFISFLCWLTFGLLPFCPDTNTTPAVPSPSPVVAPTPAPMAAPVSAPMAAPVSTGPIPDALKIKQDDFGVALKFKEILDPYIPVELVSGSAEFNLAFDLTQGDSTQIGLSSKTAFCDGGYTIKGEIDETNQASYDSTVKSFLHFVMDDWGIATQPACDAGYRYFYDDGSNLPEISCCTAPQLSALDQCFKGRQEANPPCWSPPDTTPQPGQAIAKVKVLVTSALVADGWTEADTLKRLERANRLVASSEGLTAQLRFTLYAQQTVNAADFGTNADDSTIANTANFGSSDADKSNYDVILYLFKEEIPASGSVVGKAGTELCAGDPTAAVANVYANLVVPHELMHTLGAIHDPATCNDYIIDIDLGMGACNVEIMQSAIPTFTCLATA